jgi:TPR repeat protein
MKCARLCVVLLLFLPFAAAHPQTAPASGQTTNDVTSRGEAAASFFAAIAKVPVPYYRGEHFWVVGTTPPQGQFVANQHVCVNWVLTWKGKKYVNIELPGGGSVYAVYSTENFIPDPANNLRCVGAHQQYTLEQSKRSGDASSGTSAQSASPEQLPSEAAQAKSNVGGTGTDAGSLEAGLAAEKRGDWTAALLLLKPLAEQGNERAQNSLGYMYENGEGAPKDNTEAMKWYRKAADQGNAVAQNNLGYMYYNGEGVPEDNTEAMNWFRRAADHGNADAQNNLGGMYYNGQGVPQDHAEAMKWFRKAADQGDADAQNNLGVMYYNGEGVPKDNTEAMKWYRKAADQGNVGAQENITRLNKQVEQDKKMKPKLAARKEIGDTVCYPSSCTGSTCDIYGQVENVHNDKIEVRVHLSDHDQLNWISYNDVIECHR